MVHELQQRMALVQFLQEELKSCSGSGELFLLISGDLGGGQTTKITAIFVPSIRRAQILAFH